MANGRAGDVPDPDDVLSGVGAATCACLSGAPLMSGRMQKQLGLALEALEAIADGEGTAQVIAQQTMDDITRVGMEAIAMEAAAEGPAMTTPTEPELVERLRSNEALPLCPYDRRSPDYWTTDDDAPCVVCGTLNEPDAPNLCRGADTRIMAEAADRIQTLEAALAAEREAWQPIETADRAIDNEILGCGDYCGKLVRFVAVWNGVEWYAGWGNAIQPTHWRPLPEPPAIRARSIQEGSE